jgi:hypothetical protein
VLARMGGSEDGRGRLGAPVPPARGPPDFGGRTEAGRTGTANQLEMAFNVGASRPADPPIGAARHALRPPRRRRCVLSLVRWVGRRFEGHSERLPKACARSRSGGLGKQGRRRSSAVPAAVGSDRPGVLKKPLPAGAGWPSPSHPNAAPTPSVAVRSQHKTPVGMGRIVNRNTMSGRWRQNRPNKVTSQADRVGFKGKSEGRRGSGRSRRGRRGSRAVNMVRNRPDARGLWARRSSLATRPSRTGWRSPSAGD